MPTRILVVDAATSFTFFQEVRVVCNRANCLYFSYGVRKASDPGCTSAGAEK